MKRKIDLAQYRFIAHRGLHDSESSENSLGAFKKALEAGLPMELDIHLTKDGQLVVFHDSDLKRMTGKEGTIELLDLATLREEYALPDGSKIPTFEEVLDLVNEQVPIVVELKPYGHNHKILAKAALKALERIKNTDRITLISFDPRCLFPCKKGPFSRGLLIADERKDVLLFRFFFDYLDVEDVLVDHPKVKRFHKKKPLNVWTVRSVEALEKLQGKVDMITFEHIDKETIAAHALKA